MSKNDFKVIAGLDIGNGFVKSKIQVDDNKPRRVDLPSAVDYITNSHWLPVEPDDKYMDDFINVLDCDIKSSALPEQDKRRILVGERAVSVSNSLRVFNLDDNVVKCDNPLSVQLVLSTIAAEIVRTYWFENKSLPTESLQADVTMGIALPFADYVAYRERYKQMFEGSRHTVHIHNFDVDVTVNIDFDEVIVLAEGAAAVYAIAELGPEFLEAALDVSKENGLEVDDSITGETLAGYLNVVGIDVGEGTVNYPVFIDGKISPEASSSINKGYGTCLNSVVAATRNEGYALNSRKELDNLLRCDTPTPMQKAVQNKIKPALYDEIDIFTRDVTEELKHLLGPIKLSTNVIYIFGGGSGQIQEQLYPRLLDAVKIDEGIYIPLVYLDASFSRDLNRNGLFQVAEITANEK